MADFNLAVTSLFITSLVQKSACFSMERLFVGSGGSTCIFYWLM